MIHKKTNTLPLIEDKTINSFNTPSMNNEILESYYQVALANIDYQEMHDVNQRLIKCTNDFHTYSKAVALASDALAEATLVHERAYRRNYLNLEHVKPDSVRRERSKLYTEDFEDEVIYYKAQHDNLKKLLEGIRQELRTLEILAYNYRRELQLGG